MLQKKVLLNHFFSVIKKVLNSSRSSLFIEIDYFDSDKWGNSDIPFLFALSTCTQRRPMDRNTLFMCHLYLPFGTKQDPPNAFYFLTGETNKKKSCCSFQLFFAFQITFSALLTRK